MALKFVAAFETRLTGEDGKPYTLIWGDRCEVLGGSSGGRVKVRARTVTGTVPEEALSEERLLEIYVIDVGQGDGILLHTPDDEWHLVDGGNAVGDQRLNREPVVACGGTLESAKHFSGGGGWARIGAQRVGLVTQPSVRAC